MVWLNLIPCFDMIWIFFTISRLADSLRSEFHDRRLRDDGDFGRALGITYASLGLAAMIPYIGSLFGLAALVCWIIYWVKIAGYNRQLATVRTDGSPAGDWDDDDWTRQRRKDYT